MRKVNRILALLFVFALVLSMTVFAADEGTFNASVELNYTDQQIEVIVPDENDTVLKEQKPTLTIKCAFEKAYVKLGDEVVDAAPVLADGYITFRVAAAGTYLIVEGEAPVVVTPTPTPTPEVTPVPSPTVTPTPTPVPSPSPTPTPIPGEVKDVSPDTNTGGAKLTNSEKELKDAIPLTEDEKQAVENGEDLVVWLNVEDGEDKVSATDKNLVVKKQGSYKIGMYLNIDMYKQIGNRAPERLNKLNDDVTISLTLPERLINKNSNLFRNYRVICVQDDVASVIKPTFNATAKTLSFETNHFSTYAIAYKDTNVPQTGDDSHVVLWGAATLLSAAALITTAARLRKKTEEN